MHAPSELFRATLLAAIVSLLRFKSTLTVTVTYRPELEVRERNVMYSAIVAAYGGQEEVLAPFSETNKRKDAMKLECLA